MMNITAHHMSSINHRFDAATTPVIAEGAHFYQGHGPVLVVAYVGSAIIFESIQIACEWTVG